MPVIRRRGTLHKQLENGMRTLFITTMIIPAPCSFRGSGEKVSSRAPRRRPIDGARPVARGVVAEVVIPISPVSAMSGNQARTNSSEASTDRIRLPRPQPPSEVGIGGGECICEPSA